LQGALVMVFDVNFISSAPTGSAVNEAAFRQNLETFVSSPPVAPPPAVAAPVPTSAPTLSAFGMLLLGCGLLFFAARKLRAPGMLAVHSPAEHPPVHRE
jgi:hypothetical protein